jgi:limonene-1,2-epoxide hydrolase
VLLLGLVVAACTSGTESATPIESTTTEAAVTTTTVAATTSVAPTTTEAPNVVELFVETISDPGFAAQVEVVGRQETVVGAISLSGVGAVDGAASTLRQEADMSGLSFVAFDANSRRVVGPGAVTEVVEETRLVDGLVYSMVDGQWTVRTADETDGTTLGHVIDRFAATEGWEEIGLSESDPSLTVLHPTEDIDYDPLYWSIDPSIVSSTMSDTEVHVTADGFPAAIFLDLVISFDDGAGESVTGYEYRLAPPVSTPLVEAPDDATASLQELVEYFAEEEGDGPFPFFDFQVPADLGVVDQGEGFISLARYGGAWNLVFADQVFGEPVTLDRALPSLLDEVNMASAETEPSDFGGFPAVKAIDGPRQLFFSVAPGGAGVIVMWLGTTGDEAADRAAFDDVLATLEWTSSGGAVPGTSIGSAELQTDTVALVETLAAGTHDECDITFVLDTEVVGGDDESWIEHWTLQTCGGIDTYEIMYVESEPGGTEILMGSEPIAAYGHTHES